jgi:glutamine amidotransferase
MTPALAIIDYGAGNLRSVVNAFRSLGVSCRVTSAPGDLCDVPGIVLPGVGAFGDCIGALGKGGMTEALTDAVLGNKKPFLGICLGLQILAQEGLEHGRHQGLGWLNGRVEKISPQGDRFRIPHMGWNNLKIHRSSGLFDGMKADPAFYFVHSYHFVPDASSAGCVTSTAWHGQDVTASISQGNIHGVQFHPEKSQDTGLKLLENFVRMVKAG